MFNSLRATIVGAPPKRTPVTSEQRIAAVERALMDARREISALRAEKASLERQLSLKIRSFEEHALQLEEPDSSDEDLTLLPEPEPDSFDEPTRRGRPYAATIRRSELRTAVICAESGS